VCDDKFIASSFSSSQVPQKLSVLTNASNQQFSREVWAKVSARSYDGKGGSRCAVT